MKSIDPGDPDNRERFGPAEKEKQIEERGVSKSFAWDWDLALERLWKKLIGRE